MNGTIAIATIQAAKQWSLNRGGELSLDDRHNSAASRSQDQLHIHVACIAPKVAEFLRRHQRKFTKLGPFLARPFSGTELRR